MQTQSIALQNFLSLLRAVGSLVGAYLVGHAIFGHTVSQDTLSVIGGAALTLASTIWGIATKSSTIEGIESSLRSIGAAVGGLFVAAGKISADQLMTILGAIVPIVAFIQSVVSKSKNQAVASGTAKVSPITNKVVSIIAVLLCLGTMASAQSPCGVVNPGDSAKYVSSGVWYLSITELKDAAKVSYFKMFDYVTDTTKYDSTTFDIILKRFEYWRQVVDLKLTDKKDRDDFHNWLVAEARAAGKLKYEKKSE